MTVRTATAQPVQRLSTSGRDAAELTALVMTIVIALGAFAWSFAALSDLAKMAGIDSRLAWVGPIFVDGAIVQSAVALVSLQRRARLEIDVRTGTKVFFWAQLAIAELVSIVGNGFHAAESDHRTIPAVIAAVVAGAAPLAGLAATHGLTALIEVPRSAPEPVEVAVERVDTAAEPVDAEWTEVDSERAALDSGYTAAVQALDSGVEPDPLAVRDAEIRRRHESGESFREIAAAVGLSHSRVAQIVRAGQAVDSDAEVLSLVR